VPVAGKILKEKGRQIHSRDNSGEGGGFGEGEEV